MGVTDSAEVCLLLANLFAADFLSDFFKKDDKKSSAYFKSKKRKV